MTTVEKQSFKSAKPDAFSNGVSQAKAKAYERAYYPKELRGEYVVKTDSESGELKFTKEKQ